MLSHCFIVFAHESYVVLGGYAAHRLTFHSSGGSRHSTPVIKGSFYGVCQASRVNDTTSADSAVATVFVKSSKPHVRFELRRQATALSQ